MLVYQPRYRNSELMTKPILPRLKGLHLDSALFTESADLALDVDTPSGDRWRSETWAIDLLRAEIRESHELTLLRSDRAMTDCRPVSLFSIETAR